MTLCHQYHWQITCLKSVTHTFKELLIYKTGSSTRLPKKQSSRYKNKLLPRQLVSSYRETYNVRDEEEASLVVQWLRIRLPMQGTRVWALVREDPTCRGATKPVRHNYWACALEPTSHNYWACKPQLLSPRTYSPCSTTREATTMRSPCTATKSSPRSPQLEKAHAQQWRPNTAKNKQIINKFLKKKEMRKSQ